MTVAAPPRCSVDGCDRSHVARDLCGKHYQRMKKHGDPTFSYFELSPGRRFWAMVDRRETWACWEWRGTRLPSGYGKFENTTAHRWSYIYTYGPVDDDLVIDHLCRNTGCVNPYHLEAVTQRENLVRGETLTAARAAQTHCLRGHAFDVANTYTYPNGTRGCRACGRMHAQNKRDRGLDEASRALRAEMSTPVVYRLALQ